MIRIESDHVPPSVNMMFRNAMIGGKVRRVKAKTYKTWLENVKWDFAGKERIEGPFTVRITLNRGAIPKRSDIDNRIKPVLDALVTHGRIDDDHMCQSLSVAFSGDSRALLVEVESA